MPSLPLAAVLLFASVAPVAAEKPPVPAGRGSPREMVETFCFAWDALRYRVLEAIPVAEACVPFPPETSAADRLQIVLILGKLIDLVSPPFVGAASSRRGNRAVLHNDGKVRIALEADSDGKWRFDAATVADLTRMYQAALDQGRSYTAQRAQLAEGLGDPTELFTTFLARALAADYEGAALCLDLSRIPPEQRRREGARRAWLLAAAIQRLGYTYSQDIPVDPTHPPYPWYAGREGAVVAARVRQEGSPDRWAFNAPTVDGVDRLWQQVKGRPIDVRWRILSRVVADPGGVPQPPAPPPDLDPDFASPRAMLKAFLRATDDAEHDDAGLERAATFLDLSDLPPAEAARLGPRLVEKLEVLLRKIRPTLAELDDHWSAPPVVLGDGSGPRVRLVRRADARWGVSKDTVARLPALFDALAARDKAQPEYSAGRTSPRETFSTFLRAVNDGHFDQAADCLDLTSIPASARDNLGPLLAVKLKTVIDRIGRVYFHELPAEADGPRYIWHRGPAGRIVLSRRADQPDKGWRFSDSTVRDIDRALDRLVTAAVDPALASRDYITTLPSWRAAPGVRVRLLVPPALRTDVLGLGAWQWVGVALLVVVLAVVYWLLEATLAPVVRRLCGLSVEDHAAVARGLRGVSAFLTLLAGYKLLPLVDLPVSVAAAAYTADKFLLTAAMVWAGYGVVNLVLLVGERRRQAAMRGFQDLLLPFFARLVKAALVLGGVTYLVSCFDDGALLGRFLAGLGVIGLAVSLAAQDTLKNLFATMLLIADRSFSVGDRIHVGSHEGDVVEVGFRSTRLRTQEDSVLILPNALLANGTIDNMGVRVFRRVTAQVSIAPDADPELLVRLREGIERELAARTDHDTGRTEVTVSGFRGKGVEVHVLAYVRGGAAAARAFQEALVVTLLDQARRLGLKVAT